MEEDIKILEEKVELYYDCAVIDEDGFDMRVDIAFMKKDAQALQNLIKGYRNLEMELEKENESLVRQYEYQGALMVNEYFSKEQVFELFIPKSKIKEKIEEYQRLIKEVQDNEEHYNEIPLYEHDIEVLQELMEDK